MTTARKKSPATSPNKIAKKTAAKPAKGGVRLEPVLAALRQRAPASRQAQAEAFARAFYKRMSADELEQHGPAGWAALALDFFDMVRARKPGAPSVRIFNPGMDRDGWESPHTVVQVANDDMPFLVDSVTMALADQGVGVHVLGHPVVQVQRDKAGKLLAVGAEAGDGARRGRRLGRDAPQDAGDRRRPRDPAHAGVRRRSQRGAGIPALGRRQPLHLPRLPRIRRGREGRQRTVVPGGKLRPRLAAGQGE